MFKRIFIDNQATLIAPMLATLMWAEAPAARAAGYSLDDVAFMVGHWRGPGAEPPEEIWFPARAGVITGVMRWPIPEGRYVLELLTIAEEPDGVIFRFKHFDPDITAWEKERANTYRLTEVAGDCATFAGIDTPDGVPATIQYCRADAETLVFRGAGKDQPIAETDFVLTFTDIDTLAGNVE